MNWAKAKAGPVTLDCDGMGSIPANLEAQNVPLLLSHERGGGSTALTVCAGMRDGAVLKKRLGIYMPAYISSP